MRCGLDGRLRLIVRVKENRTDLQIRGDTCLQDLLVRRAEPGTGKLYAERRRFDTRSTTAANRRQEANGESRSYARILTAWVAEPNPALNTDSPRASLRLAG
jgi:hypothetical protein